MIVYGEMLVVENAIIGAVLLYITGRICGVSDGVRFRRARFAAGSLICGFFSLSIFLVAGSLMLITMDLFFFIVVCALTFGRSKKQE